MKKSSLSKVIGIVVIVLLILLAGIPLILEHFIFRNSVYSVLTNGEWASFLGSYIGGVVGGAGTLIALWVTTKETRKVQEENLNQLKEDRQLSDKKERKQFADGIAHDISSYIADINNYFNISRHSERLENDRQNASRQLRNVRNQIQSQYNQQKKLKIEIDTEKYGQIEIEINQLKLQEAEAQLRLQHIESEIDKNQANRTVAIERYFYMKIKLQDIPKANDLLEKLAYIHTRSMDIEGTAYDFMDKETPKLLSITVDFINKYVNQDT